MAIQQTSSLIDNAGKLQKLLSKLVDLDSSAPQLFIDLEGHGGSQPGPLSLLQLLVLRERHVYLIDLHVLGKDAFSTASSSGTTLKSILESSIYTKAFFDVRGDSRRLYAEYGIELSGVQDIQLMELATRPTAYKWLKGLKNCIEQDAGLSNDLKNYLLLTKVEGKKLFAPELGGTYAVFDQRPLADAIETYCVADVLVLPSLWAAYRRKLSPQWSSNVISETKSRVERSRVPLMTAGRGDNPALGPGHWLTLPRNSAPVLTTALPHDFVPACSELIEQLRELQNRAATAA